MSQAYAAATAASLGVMDVLVADIRVEVVVVVMVHSHVK